MVTASLICSFILKANSVSSNVYLLQMGQINISFFKVFIKLINTKFYAHFKQNVCIHFSFTGSFKKFKHSGHVNISSINGFSLIVIMNFNCKVVKKLNKNY